MTAKRDKKDEPKSDKKPKLKKETVKDLTPPTGTADEVQGGATYGGHTRTPPKGTFGC